VEMEIPNLNLTKKPKLVRKLNLLLSNSEKDRQHLVESFVLEDVLNLEKVDIVDDVNHNTEILNVNLKGIGLQLTKESKKEDK